MERTKTWHYSQKLHFARFSTTMDLVQLGSTVSSDPVRQANSITESTTPLNADPNLVLLVYALCRS